MNMDDVACITVLTAAVLSIGMAVAPLFVDEARRSAHLAKECQRSPSTQIVPSASSPRNG
jgi:hypothetical protein